MKRKILLFGLGNELRTDDAVGLFVVRQIQEEMNKEGSRLSSSLNDVLDIRESEEMGLALLDYIVGYHTLVIVDSVQTRKVSPGSLHIFEEKDLKILPGTSPHYAGISEVLALGRALNLPMPRKVKIFAVEVNDPFTFGTNVSSEVKEAIPYAVSTVIQYIRSILNEAGE